jgi:hypothetical protein
MSVCILAESPGANSKRKEAARESQPAEEPNDRNDSAEEDKPDVNVVPEPSAVVLLAIGGGVWAAYSLLRGRRARTGTETGAKQVTDRRQ